MRIFFLFIPIFIFGFDFEFAVANIYKLKSNEFSIENGLLSVNTIFDKTNNQLNKSIKTQDSKLVMDKNLRYYYHTNRFMNFKEDLIELTLSGNKYMASVKKLDSNNCFIIVKHIVQKTLDTKSRAMVVDLDTLDLDNNSKIYFTCLKNNNYIY
ncbi:hypothetical protein CCY99_08265 [Helicobacter sp. 16-1353]|uniref:hypothetical protein n=1 Tax=Helicobacter sp. 16-1353 TaxID=2004996 RepID=UPI000DCB8B2E|nr:hypothetical protein [Helicobacter sp. 16-1353]RAX51784.1 hypothetical protein CCY99_08265 [Helicobacter sp. 16-1353]